jgi:dihydroxyacetone kinase-like predicted kinase
LPSKSVGECYAALSLLDTSSGDIDEIERGSEQIMASIMTGTVSRASRNTVRDGLAVREGEFIGFSDGRIYSASPDISDAAAGLMASLHAEDYGILMLVCGCDTEAQTSMKLKERLEKLFPMTEVILLDGGQPVYDYIMILE